MSNRRPPVTGDIRSVRAADGAKLEYEIVGDGPPLVMLHGFLANRFTFSRQRAALAAHYRLILIGFRGSAGSDDLLPTDYGVGTSELDDLRAVLDAEKLDRVNLLAHSSGGATAFVFATQSPDRVARAVLIEPSLFALLPPVDRARSTAENAAVIAVGEAEGPEACLRAAVESVGGEAWTQLDAETRAARLHALAAGAPFAGPHIHSLITLVVGDEDVTALSPPTLLLYGENSFWFEGIIADRFRALRPDLRVLTIENSAHNVHRDRADIVNAEVLAFLSEERGMC